MKKFISIAKAFIEQGISSLGSFLFFFILARWLKPERFGQFSAIWISVHALIEIATAWVHLPITSMSVSQERQAVFYGVCLQRLLRLFYFVPFLLALALYFAAREFLVSPLALTAIILLSLAILTVDFLRHYLIRRGHKMAAAILVSTKWAGGISLVLLLYIMRQLTVENAVVCMLAGNLLALAVTIFTIKRLQCNIDLVSNTELNHTVTKFSKPLVFQALSGSASGVVVAFAMRSWISTAALGAYYAIRSICSVMSPLMQMMRTHYSAHLTLKSSFKRNHFIGYSIFIVAGTLTVLSWFFKEFIIQNTIGSSYLAYSGLLPIILFQVFVMLYNSLLSAHIRRAGDTKVFKYFGCVSLLSGVVIVFVAKYTGLIQLAVWVIVLATIAQCGLLIRTDRKLRRKEQ